MFDNYNRNITYLRISVTDRCNLRCTYCMPGTGRQKLQRENILTFGEIVNFVRIASANGIRKVRLTGGEPLMRKDIVSLVKMLKELPGIEDLCMTTNGILLAEYAGALKEAGLDRINVSLDTINPERFREITRSGDVGKVLDGIAVARKVGLEPVKLNCVVKRSRFEPDAVLVARYAAENNLEVRYIREMDLENGIFYEVDGGEGGKCLVCNRIRLTANGDVNPCLFDTSSYNIRELGARKAFLETIRNKPACGSMNKKGTFYNIGG